MTTVERYRLCVGALLAAATSACHSKDVPVSRDEGGAEVIRAVAPPPGATPAVAAPASVAANRMILVEEMRIVSNDTSVETSLTDIGDMAASGDGHIYTAHWSERVVRVFNRTGEFVTMFGRKGEGPGDFGANFFFKGVRGDTVQIFDQALRRISIMSRDGTLLETMRIHAGVDRILSTLLPNRMAVVNINFTSGRLNVDSTVFAVTDLDGTVVTRIADAPPPRRSTMLRFLTGSPRVEEFTDANGRKSMRVTRVPGSGGSTLVIPTLGEPRWASRGNPAGTGAAIALSNGVWGGNKGQVQLFTVDETGHVTVRVVQLESRAFMKRDVDTLIQGFLERFRGATGTWSSAAISDTIRKVISVPRDLGPVRQMLLGDDGTIWLRPEWSQKEWTVLDSRGTLLFSVTMMEELRVYQADAEHVWGVLTDPDGLPVIVRYRVQAAPAFQSAGTSR